MTSSTSPTRYSAEIPSPDRGRLHVDTTVLRKISEYAADQVPQTRRSPRKIAGLDVGERGASAKITGENALDVSLDIAVRYPTSVPSVATEIRERVTDELTRLTGKSVRSVQIVVSALISDTASRVS